MVFYAHHHSNCKQRFPNCGFSADSCSVFAVVCVINFIIVATDVP